MPDDQIGGDYGALRGELAELRRRLDGLEARTSLVSPSFLRRAFAVLGHYMVASLIVAVPFYILLFFAMLLAEL